VLIETEDRLRKLVPVQEVTLLANTKPATGQAKANGQSPDSSNDPSPANLEDPPTT